MKHKIILLLFICLFGSVQKSWSSSGDTIIYQKPCFDYVRMAVKLGENRWKITEKKGNILLFEGEYEISHFTHDMLLTKFNYHFDCTKFLEKYYSMEGVLRLTFNEHNPDSFVVQIFENKTLVYSYVFNHNLKIDFVRILNIQDDQDVLFTKLMAFQPNQVNHYVDEQIFENYQLHNVEENPFYYQTYYRNNQEIQRNTWDVEPERTNSKYAKSQKIQLVFGLKHVTRYPHKHIEYYSDYSVKAEFTLDSTFLSRVYFFTNGKVMDTSFWAIQWLPKLVSGDTMKPQTVLLYQEVFDKNGNQTYFFQTNEFLPENAPVLQASSAYFTQNIWTPSPNLSKSLWSSDSITILEKEEEYKVKSRKANVYDYLNVTVKKDFETCLFGLWSLTQDKYTTSPQYLEISALGSDGSFFKVTDDYHSYLIIDAKNKVLFSSYSDFEVEPFGAFYKLLQNDTLYFFSPEFNLVFKVKQTATMNAYGQHLWVLDEENNRTHFFTLQRDTIITHSIADKLTETTLKYHFRRFHVFTDMHHIYQLQTKGLTEVWATSDTILAVKTRSDYMDFIASFKGNKLSFYDVTNTRLKAYTLEMDNPQETLNELTERRNYWRNKGYFTKSDDFLIYTFQGKKGCFNGTLLPVLAPEWDDIDVENKIATKLGLKYKFNDGGDVFTLPQECVETNILGVRCNFYVNREKGIVVVKDRMYYLASLIECIGIFKHGFDENYEFHQAVLITTDNRMYQIQSDSLWLMQDATGILRVINSTDKYVYVYGERLEFPFDRVDQMGGEIWLNTMIKANETLKVTDGRHTYLLDLSNKEKRIADDRGGQEKEIWGQVYGYNALGQLYYRNCDNYVFYPECYVHMKVLNHQNINLLLITTDYEKDKGNGLPFYLLMNPDTKQTTNFWIRPYVYDAGKYCMVQDSRNFYHVVDADLNEMLPFSEMKEVQYKYNHYYVYCQNRWYRYSLENKKVDTLSTELRYFDEKKYSCIEQGEIRVYTYEHILLAASGSYFIDNLTTITELDIQDSVISYNYWYYFYDGQMPYYSSRQKMLFKAFMLTEGYNSVNSTLPTIDFPEYMNITEKQRKIKSRGCNLKPVDRNDESDMYAEEFDRYVYRDSTFLKGANLNQRDWVAYVKSILEHRLAHLNLRYDDFYCYSNGLLYYHGLYIELLDSGYRCWTFENIFDTTKLTSLTEYLQHQVSLNPSFWGVTCSQDLEKYNLEYFAAKFGIENKVFFFQQPDNNQQSSGLRLTYDDLKEYMTPEAKALFENIMK
ncbi:MAG: hypothetical protein H6607_13350 [Flavobacteriales bacterium]|nr:hypothetical protein [Flavobacteriales bacterium]